MFGPNININHPANQFLITPRTLTHLRSGTVRVCCACCLQLGRGFPGKETLLLCCSFLAMLFAVQFARAQVQVHIATSPTPRPP